MVIETETYCTFHFKDGSKLRWPSRLLGDYIHFETVKDACRKSVKITVREEII
jgi:hypothetical protein